MNAGPRIRIPFEWAVLRVVAPAIACLTLVFGVHAAQWRTMGAGSDAHAWALTPIEIPGGAEGKFITRGQMYRLPSNASLGAITPLRAHTLNEPPLFMSAYGDRLMLIYEPTSAGDPTSELSNQDGERAFPVRSVRVLAEQSGVTFLHPPDRYTVEPPLVMSGTIIAAADTALGLAALTRLGNDEKLRLLTRGGWREVALPADFMRGDRAQLVADEDRLALIGPSDSGAAMWSLSHPDDTWRRKAIAELALDHPVVVTPGGPLLVWYDEMGQHLALRTLMNQEALDLAVVDGVAPDHAVARLGENITVAWMDLSAPDRMRLAVISSITGRVLYNDFANFGPPLTPADLRLVAFLLSAIMLGVLLFLLKPESSAQAAPPAGWALADSGRRLAAATIDLFLAGFAASMIWQTSLKETIDPSYLFLMDGGDNWPVMTTLGLYFLHGAIAEWLFGRTLGKAVLRCRVSSTRGERVKIWQAAARNLVKVMAPPLVGLVLIDPNRRHPGDLLGGTLVITPADTDESASDAGSAGDEKTSDNAMSEDNRRQD